jgi:hypothetical protein
LGFSHHQEAVNAKERRVTGSKAAERERERERASEKNEIDEQSATSRYGLAGDPLWFG